MRKKWGEKDCCKLLIFQDNIVNYQSKSLLVRPYLVTQTGSGQGKEVVGELRVGEWGWGLFPIYRRDAGQLLCDWVVNFPLQYINGIKNLVTLYADSASLLLRQFIQH